jgi:hypothetical protein
MRVAEWKTLGRNESEYGGQGGAIRPAPPPGFCGLQPVLPWLSMLAATRKMVNYACIG